MHTWVTAFPCPVLDLALKKKKGRKEAQWCNVQALSMLLSRSSKNPVWKHGKLKGEEKPKSLLMVDF